MPVESGSETMVELDPGPRRLNVCIILASTAPPRWWHSLLRGIQSHPNLNLAQILISTPVDTDSVSDIGEKPPANATTLTKRLASIIIQDIVDKPRLQHNPLERSALEPCLQDRIEHVPSKDTVTINTALTLDHVDVVIQSHEVPARWNTSLPTRLWMPDLKTLHARAVAALTARDPFFRMDVLQRLTEYESKETVSGEWTLLAGHTLPLQTFSITDLEIAAHACLPSLLMAQLNWLSFGHEPCPSTANIASGTGDSTFSTKGDIAEMTAALGMTHEQLNITPLRSALKLLCQQFRQRLRDRLYYEQWQLAFHDRLDITNSIEELINAPMGSYQSLVPPDRHSWADPHLTVHDGSLHVFFEAIEDGENQGWINGARLDQSGVPQAPTKVLTSDHHLSYPFTLAHDGQLWMIPETSSSGTVSLYRCSGSADQWEQVAQLMSGVDIADCTLLHREGRWWLFGNTMTHPTVDERDELRIWYADELTGPWQPHPLNPVLMGVHHARMAGGFFYSNGQLFRPSQFGGWRYGHSINLARVDRLTPEDYHETIVGQISPTPGTAWLGCHTIAHLDGVTLIDRVRRRSRLMPRARARVRGNG